MVGLKLIADYFLWHYTIAIRNIFYIWFDFEWFLWNYFSIKRLLITFFVPWKRLGESTKDYFDIAAVGTAIIVTTLMRAVGVVFRSITILSGLLLMFLLIPLSFIILIIWLTMPIILLFIFALGAELIVRPF